MRIAIVTHRFSPNDGQGRVNFEVVRALLARGHQLLLVATYIDEALQGSPGVECLYVPVGGWPSGLLRNQIFAWRSARALARRNVDLTLVNGFITWAKSDINAVHFVHSAWLKSPAHEAKQSLGPNAVYQRLYTCLNARFERYAFAGARKLVAVSNNVKRELIAVGVPAEKICVVPNGVDTDEFRPGPESRAELGLPEDKVLALFAGGIKTYRKNLDTVLKALVNVPELHLAVAGNVAGSPFPHLAKQLGVAGRVHFLGHRTDMPALMRAVDFLVFPSRFEPFGLVILEAMASGLPVITSAAAGASALVEPASGIVLDSAEDRQALAAAMQNLMTHKSLRATMGEAAREVASRNCWRETTHNYAEIIERQIQLRKPA